MDPLWKERGKPVPWDVEKAEVPSHVSDSAFMASCSSHTAQVTEATAESGGTKNCPQWKRIGVEKV